jgi:dihydrofolate reductase
MPRPKNLAAAPYHCGTDESCCSSRSVRGGSQDPPTKEYHSEEDRRIDVRDARWRHQLPREVGCPVLERRTQQVRSRSALRGGRPSAGRKTYEGFAEAWPSRTGDEYSDRINSLPKYVASTTLRETKWNATLISGDVADEVAKLKQQPGQNILKFGTGELDRALTQHNLIDEFHFWCFPVFAGSVQRLFDGFDTTHLKLVDTTTFSTGIVVHVYSPK